MKEVIPDLNALLAKARAIAVGLQGGPVLSPERLQAEVDQALRAFNLAPTESATSDPYVQPLRYWCAWSQARLGRPLDLPTSTAVAQLFVIDHFGQPRRGADSDDQIELEMTMPEAVDAALVAAGYKAKLGRQRIATINQRMAMLSWVHREKGLDSPTQDRATRSLLGQCRKLARQRGEGAKSKAPAMQEALDAMLATCDDTLVGIRDRALLLFGWTTGGRRRSEIAQARVEDIEWINSKTSAVFILRRSKIGDVGPKPLKGEAAIALSLWMERAKIKEGALFRRLWGTRVGEALSGHAIGAVVKRRAQMAGLAGDFAGHSLRCGFVAEALLNDMSLAQTIGHLGASSVLQSVRQCQRTGTVLASNAANLLPLGRKKAKD